VSGPYKGFARSHLEWAGWARFEDQGIVIDYLDVNGRPYRSKLFSAEGRPLRWLGENKPQIPYGLETLRLGGEVAFLTEGESCAWTLRAAFPRNPALGLPGASSWKPEWARLLEQFPVIYLSFDNDEAGRSLLDTVWPFLPWGRRVKLPAGQDTRDVLQLYGGLEEYERLLADADYIAGAERYLLEMGRKADRAAA
jgi:DNA primase